jgi:hypothetical protein
MAMNKALKFVEGMFYEADIESGSLSFLSRLKDIEEKPMRLVHFVPERKWGCNKLETS